jgi:hypothetical protein
MTVFLGVTWHTSQEIVGMKSGTMIEELSDY